MASRPQIGIDRLPVRRLSNEPKEAMNCKSCRKRKIKCNRLRPSCEACQVFNCPCIYDAVPKKRGPKTDVLESLVRRMNGLERRLEEEGKPKQTEEPDAATVSATASASEGSESNPGRVVSMSASPLARKLSGLEHRHQQQQQERQQQQQHQKQQKKPQPVQQPQPQPQAQHQNPHAHPIAQTHPQAQALQARRLPTNVGYQESFEVQQPPNDALLDVYFTMLHSKPYYILDEAATRSRWQNRQLPSTVVDAIHAVTMRYAPGLVGGHNAAVKLSEEYAARARLALDSDEPTIENIQVTLLLSIAFFQAGKGSAISMAFAQNLHREIPPQYRTSSNEREGRRRLFWSLYVMDRFMASGSKRPSLIADESVSLRMPAWQQDSTSVPYEGNYFSNGINMPLVVGSGKVSQSGSSMLIEIVRVLGITNRYLAAGGVKGDSHFPWHAQSNLSRIRHDLDAWAANAQDAFSSIETLFGQPESSTLVLSKLIYHLVHCLVYRPFLPVELTELSGTGQHQSWQIEATNLCFLHANAIAELVEIGRSSSITNWPAFVGYCLCTAGTVHIHGAHFIGRENDVFARSAEFLSREMAQLSELRVIWAGVQHQKETLQTVYGCHSQLVKSLSSNPIRFSPVFQMEDFFDRYPGQFIDGAHLTFSDITPDTFHEGIPTYNGMNSPAWQWTNQAGSSSRVPYASIAQQMVPPLTAEPAVHRKRRRTNDVSGSTQTLPTASTDTARKPTSPGHPRSALSPEPAISPHSASIDKIQTFTQNPTSPSFGFSPWHSQFALAPGVFDTGQGFAHEQDNFDNFFSLPQKYDHPTPGGISATGSTHTDGDKDPFLNLLEQLAENEQSRGGPSDLDFFLGASEDGL